jgi:ATP-binding cassette subfamily B multidrug efflux pump
LREKIGYVPQESFVMSGSIGENINFGKKEENTFSAKEIIEKVQLADFVDKLPDGMEGELYQAGKNISGGQKQRINIGRALALNPDLLIFDDSFSALDYRTDYLIRKAIKEMSTDKIIIMVAQRVTTVMDADKIILLDKGEIKGIGSHKELLAGNKIYREIVSSQLSEEELA